MSKPFFSRRTSGLVAGALVAGAVLFPAGGLAAHAFVAPAATSYEVGQHFSDYYAQHDGLRLLGYAIPDESPLPDNGLTEQVRINVPIQYFEKGRIEYQGYMGLSGEWEYTYGLLVPEMLGEVTSANNLSISATSVTYIQLRTYADPARRVAPPAGFTGGTQKTADGENVFIPQSATLGVEAGYMVPTYFWDYMNSGVFPGGWLHDLGLPVSVPFEATVMKDSVERSVHMQAFERGILTYAPQNPDRFKVERANIGADYLAMLQQSQGGQQDPTAAAQDVVSKYWQAIDARDYETAYGMPAASYQAQITMQQFEDGLANTVAHATNVQFSNVSQLPDGTIQLTCTVDIQTGSQPSNYSTGPNTRFFTLAQEGGTWRITGITTAP